MTQSEEYTISEINQWNYTKGNQLIKDNQKMG